MENVVETRSFVLHAPLSVVLQCYHIRSFAFLSSVFIIKQTVILFQSHSFSDLVSQSRSFC
jgi:hypothetical protein